MDTLDRLIIREFGILFVILLLGLSALYLGIDFFTNFWGYKLPVPKTLLLYSYKIPAAFEQFLPVAVLMATLLVLSNMSRQNEILALYACGISNFRLLSTLVTAVSILCTGAFLSFDHFVPHYFKKQIFVTRGIDPNQEGSLQFNRTAFWSRSGNLIYNVGRFIPNSNTLEDVTAYRLDPNFEIAERIRAKKAIFVNDQWILEDGFTVRYAVDDRYPKAIRFSKMGGIIGEKPGDFKTLEIVEDTMRLKDLRRFIKRNRSYGLDTTRQEVRYHERIALTFTPLIFVLLAIPFATKPLRTQSIPKSIGFCFLSVFIYLLLFRMFISIGKGGQIPPIFAGWSVNVLYFGYSIFAMFKRQI